VLSRFQPSTSPLKLGNRVEAIKKYVSDTMKKAILLLGELNNDDLNWMVLRGVKKNLQPGTILIEEGKLIDALYITLTGTLSVLIESLGSKELARLSSGEVVGEISFIDARPPLATVKAIEESMVLGIPRLHLTAKLQQDLGFASRFYHAISLCLADRLRGTVRRLGYGHEIDIPEAEQEMNPNVLEHLELSKAKFNWLMECVKSQPTYEKI
jgi:CRP/FNR family cyclic AMP-dependent transcriptional regulator